MIEDNFSSKGWEVEAAHGFYAAQTHWNSLTPEEKKEFNKAFKEACKERATKEEKK